MTKDLQFNWTRHALVWSIYIVYEIGSIFFATGESGYLLNYFVFYSLNIALFYMNAFFILPQAFHNSKTPYLLSLALLLLEISAYLGIKFGLDYTLARIRQIPLAAFTNMTRYVALNLWRGLYFLAASSLYWSTCRYILFRERAVQAQKEYALVHNAYLQQQVNPHFLFNALNLIYHSFYQLSATAAACVAMLTDVMRYTYEDADETGKTLLTDEIMQIGNLIAIHRMRFDFSLFLELEVRGPVSGQRVLRLVLLSLAENLFKYGNFKDPERPGVLLIAVNGDNELQFTSRNLKKGKPLSPGRRPTGLSNIRTRLNYTYPERHLLTIREDAEFFEVHLTIQL